MVLSKIEKLFGWNLNIAMQNTEPVHTPWTVGAHTAFSGRLCDTLWTSINYGMYVTQFFLGSPQGFKRAKISDDDLKECKKILSRFPLKIFSHFPYVANLAGSKDCLAWSGNDVQDNKTKTVLEGLSYELFTLSQVNGGVVIHPGNFPDRKKGIETIAKSINKITFSENSRLLLENSAGQGTSLATTIEELRDIINLIDETKKQHIGCCLDTCHTFAYGKYNVSKISEIDRLFSDFETMIGIEKLWLIHLNDSECPCKSKKDRHACLSKGLIWKENTESLVYLLNKCKNLGIPLVLETHGTDMLFLAELAKNIL